MNKKVLLLSVIPSDFSKLLSLAELLRANGFEVEFFMDQRSHPLKYSIEKAEENGFICHYTKRAKSSSKKGKTKIFNEKIRQTKVLIFLKRLFGEIRMLWRIWNSFNSLLKKNGVSILVTPLNSVGYNLPVYLDVAHKRGVKTVCFPFAVGDIDSKKKSMIFFEQFTPGYLFNSFFANIFPSWQVHYKNKVYLNLPSEKILALQFKKIPVAIPTSFYGVRVNRLLLENEYMKKQALVEGIAADDVFVTGSLFDDELYLLKKNKLNVYQKLCNKLSLDPGKKLILICLPPFLNRTFQENRTFNIEQLFRLFVPEDISFTNYNVILSLHPKMDLKMFDSFSFFSNIKIIQEPVEKLIPLCDLFIASYSSTIRTAVALGVPVINNDVLKLKYKLFSDLQEVTYVNSEEQYKNEIISWMEGSQKKYESENLLSSTLDGKTNSRILKQIL